MKWLTIYLGLIYIIYFRNFKLHLNYYWVLSFKKLAKDKYKKLKQRSKYLWFNYFIIDFSIKWLKINKWFRNIRFGIKM